MCAPSRLRALVVAGARTVGGLAGIDGVTPIEVDLVEPSGSTRLVAEAVSVTRTLSARCSSTPSPPSRDPGCGGPHDRAGRRSDRQRRLGQRVLSPDGLVVDYAAAKAALLNVAEALSQELGPQGIRINSVSPGPVATDLWLGENGVAATIGRAKGADGETVHRQAEASLPTGRFTTPEEVATLVTLLASPRTANVTDSNYILDGGLVKTM